MNNRLAVATVCKFPDCNLNTRRLNKLCVFHRHATEEEIERIHVNKYIVVKHGFDESKKKKFYDNMFIEKTFLNHQNVLKDLKDKFEWELL